MKSLKGLSCVDQLITKKIMREKILTSTLNGTAEYIEASGIISTNSLVMASVLPAFIGRSNCAKISTGF